ncbi:oligosaccharide flippase family protein [Nitrosopumilus sp. S4]
MDNIRVTYSGLIAFSVGISGVFLGLFFTLMITRRLSPEEFGIWSLLLSMINYFVISETLISYWTTRQVARNEAIARTAIFSSLIFSFIAIPLYAIYSFFISENSSANFDILIIGIFLLPLFFISQTLTAINLGHKPHLTSYSHILLQSLKIPVAFAFVVYFDLGVVGAIVAMFLALTGKIIFQIYVAKEKLQEKFHFKILKQWINRSWLSSFGYFSNYIQMIDIPLYSIITGSVLGVAYYQAAWVIAAIVSHSGSISQAIYPKLLSNQNFAEIRKNFTYLLYFAIPLLGISFIFSKAGLFALNPSYQEAWPIVIVLSSKIFLKVLWIIPSHVILGREQVDVEQNPSFRQLFKSTLFRIPTFGSIFYGFYTGILIILFFSLRDEIDELSLVFWWVLIGLIIEIGYASFLWIYSRKYFQISFPFKNISKYIFATLLFCGVFLLVSDSILNYDISIYKFLPSVLFQLAICVTIYVITTLIIDKEIRQLFTSVIKELKK